MVLIDECSYDDDLVSLFVKVGLCIILHCNVDEV